MNIFGKADILLPAQADMHRWAVIACDQFTADTDYWARVRKEAGQSPSTVHMILPEADLGRVDEAEAIASINATMANYLDEGVFTCYPQSYLYVERTLCNGTVRPGLIGVVDLEQYDYHPGSVSPIRATEMTVLERIPPRRRVRKDAPIEFPHVLMLCDDDRKVLIEPIAAEKDKLKKVYDFDLMENGGHITGWLVDAQCAQAFDERLQAYFAAVPEKYADLDEAPVYLAVGDGNHSLATAKSCYETMKVEHPALDLRAHPARYALVELENIHDASQVFEPIHRILFDVDAEKLLRDIRAIHTPGGVAVHYIAGDMQDTICLDCSGGEPAVAVLQEFLDQWMVDNCARIDYIHDDDELTRLARRERAVGFLLPSMEKHELFRGVICGGVLPRKTFSMGHAREKRYYLEGRKIK